MDRAASPPSAGSDVPAETLQRASPPRYTSSISRIGHLRASDADRDHIADRLRAAATEGRIGFDELEERLSKTLGARTYAELDAVVADLPRPQPVRRRSQLPASPLARAAVATAIAIPVIMAAVVALTAFLSAWLVWAIIGWYVFGHHGHRGRYHSRYRAGRGSWHAGPGAGRADWHAGPGAGRGPWA